MIQAIQLQSNMIASSTAITPMYNIKCISLFVINSYVQFINIFINCTIDYLFISNKHNSILVQF